ncbi:uncharacterized protein LOC118736650 [Rhagoletis pomonella]|uniref:uncharacterized protein LOC118736650 n=1 Tax=Rhagoletis pomonella TaxID=28610 RepID=UPI001785CE0D|nr:uncharacterized protein LOC118736650 [Rhagoletis pomonella]
MIYSYYPRILKLNRDYDLTSFIREVEIFLPLFENTPMKEYVFQRCVINKLQGEALNLVRGLGAHSTWDLIKELIKNFGIRDTYHQLYYRAINGKNNNNESHYYNYLKNILDNLNTKFEQDDNKQTEFCPAVNESTIIKTFLNNIPAHLASIIYSRSIGTLREAYYTLEETGLAKPTRKFDKLFQSKIYTISPVRADGSRPLTRRKRIRRTGDKFTIGYEQGNIPLVELKIGKHKLIYLIDTGSSTTLLDKNALPNYKRIKLDRPIIFNTLNGQSHTEYEVISEIPEEFNNPNLMAWKVTTFKNKNFQGLIG